MYIINGEVNLKTNECPYDLIISSVCSSCERHMWSVCSAACETIVCVWVCHMVTIISILWPGLLMVLVYCYCKWPNMALMQGHHWGQGGGQHDNGVMYLWYNDWLVYCNIDCFNRIICYELMNRMATFSTSVASSKTFHNVEDIEVNCWET